MGYVREKNRRLKFLISLSVLLLITLACAGMESTWCVLWQGGEWVKKENDISGVGGCCKTATNKCGENNTSPEQNPAKELPGEEEPAPAVAPESDQPAEMDIADLAGTYVGVTNFGNYYVEKDGGAITEDEIIITISETGTVEGTFIMIYDSGPQGTSCQTRTYITENGTLSGLIAGSAGTINIEYTFDLNRVNISCKSGDYRKVRNDTISGTIHISGNTVTGDGVGGITYEATKQGE